VLCKLCSVHKPQCSCKCIIYYSSSPVWSISVKIMAVVRYASKVNVIPFEYSHSYLFTIM
jgi:hypothetical protein